MDFLNLGDGLENSESTPRPRNKKKVFAVVGITLIAATIGIGTTLASNITLNNNQNVEFGQGVSQTVACETSEAGITVTPLSTFNNTAGYFNGSSYEGVFSLSQIGLSSIDAACKADYFKISVWDSSSSAPLANIVVKYNSLAGQWVYDDPGNTNHPDINGFDSATVVNVDHTAFNITPGSGNPIHSDQVYKITVESSATEPALSYNLDNLS
jgi:hypothetical protein